jgi:hypothetical protein
LVYLLATGGNPGLALGTNNTAITLIAALGSCSSLSSTTVINLNEVTTVAAVAALSPYMTSLTCTTAPTCIGSGTPDASGLAAAFTLASEFANTATGTSPGASVPAGDTVPSTLINTLADIVSSCVNTTGGIAGDGSNCGTLFTDATPSGGAAPTDVTTALLDILNNPTSNLTSLFGLMPSTPPFTPVLNAAPSTWAVILAGSQVSGQFNLQNYCRNGGSIPVTFTVTLTDSTTHAVVGIVGNPASTDKNGNYSFNAVPSGTYDITPSVPGAATLFYPTAYTHVVVSNGSNASGENFAAQVGFTVSGTVSYSGTQTGQTYLTLSGGCGNGSGNLGTTIATQNGNGSYTIRGVQPGSYTLTAWMDPLGNAVQNAIDPTGSTSSGAVTVSNANVSGAAVTMHDPTFTTPYENPSISGIIPNSQGVVIEFNPSKNNSGNGIEDANQYVVEWSTSPTVGGGGGGAQFLCAESGNVCPSHTFTAAGDNGVWLLNNATVGAGTFQIGTPYYFQARSLNTLVSNSNNQHPSGWCDYDSSSSNGCSPTPTTTSSFTSVTVGTPSCSGSCTAVSSSVTVPAGLTCPTNTSLAICPSAPLYLGLIQVSPSTGNPTSIYMTELTSPVVGANAFTVTVPNGSNYAVVGILDQLNNGGFGVGAVENTREELAGNLTISGGTQTVPGITLPATNSAPIVATQYNSGTCSGCGSTLTSYELNFKVEESNRLPVAVTLTSGPNVINTGGIVAIDMAACTDCGNGEFEYSATLAGGAPNIGDTYGFTVTYSDGTSENGSVVNGAVTAFGSTGAIVGPSDLPTLTSPNVTASSDQPAFTWTDPTLTNPSNYFYSFDLSQQSGTCPSNNCNIWQIPGQNSNGNGFSNSITSLTWNTDPTGGGSLPSVSSLASGTTYNWSIQVYDSSNYPSNEAQATVYFVAP